MKSGNYRVVIAIILLIVLLPTASYFFLRSGVKARDFRRVEPFTYESKDGDTVHAVFTDQRGDSLRDEDFANQVILASFLYYHCDRFTYCDSIPFYFSRIQDSMKGAADFQMLTYTIDPDRDSLPILKDWANTWNANPDIWHFVRGDRYTTHQIILGEYFGKIKYAEGDLKYMKPDEKVVLIGRDGLVRGYYALYNEEDMTDLLKAIRQSLGSGENH